MRSIGIFCRTLIMLAETLFLGLVCWVSSMMLSVTEFMGPLFDPSAWYRLAALELVTGGLFFYRLFKLGRYLVYHLTGFFPAVRKKWFEGKEYRLPEGYLYSLLVGLIHAIRNI